jgi:asparagine synthase (glutamine-hydrolysing)
MCGIAGAIDANAERAAARLAMLNDWQKHRGPDHTVVTRASIYTLGNTRLAVQDPSPAGHQPFVSGDGRYHCVFNGEIYNHRRLVDRYKLQMRTACDGEVIPQLWAKLGISALSELRGMFAIALVDTLKNHLYLARDCFGIKPLYWRRLSDGSLIFASELRPLVRIATGTRIDRRAIAGYLRLGAMAPDQSPIHEITSLAPNSVATFDKDCRVTMQPILPGGPLPGAQARGGLGEALADSIDLHLAADVPTALLLSAGVDSAAIAAVGCRLGRNLHCVTVATHGAADESAGAASTARHYGHAFQRVPAVLEDADIARFFTAMQRPTIDGLNTYLVSKAIHEAGFKVALSGLGGDEAVGGYSHFRLLKHLRALRVAQRMPGTLTGTAAKGLHHIGSANQAKIKRLLSKDGPRSGLDLCILQREVLPEALVAGLTGMDGNLKFNESTLESMCAYGPPGSMVAAEVATYLETMLLPDADSFSMSSSVELRVPFVDGHVFRASLNEIAAKRTITGKASIGMALDDPYLRKLAAVPKRGFSVPMRFWMTGPLLPLLRAANDPNAAVWSVVDRDAASQVGLVPLRIRDRWTETWLLVALNAWLETLSDRLAGR